MKETRLPPDAELILDWVFGYNGHTARNNVKINAEGNLVYYVAGVGVVYDHANHRQTFFTGHSDDITSLAINSDGRIVATGQVGKNAYIAVWNALTCAALSVITDAHEAIVSALAFSSDDKFLASLGRLYNKTYLIVWDWRKGRGIAQNIAHSSRVEEVEFHPSDPSQLATCGESHTRFWKLQGNVLESHGGLFIDAPKENQRSIAFLSQNRMVSGSSGGHLLEWVDRRVIKVWKNIHKGGITAIEKFGNGIITGGEDGTVLIFDEKLKQIAKIPGTPSQVYKKTGPVQSLSSSGNTIVVGTQHNEIWLIQWTDSKPMPPAECIVQGHGQGEIWGLATHPSRLISVTGSDDKTLRLWSLEDFTPMTTCLMDDEIRSVGFDPSGLHIAAGLLHGALVIFDSSNLKQSKKILDRKEARHDLKFSPDGKLLAVASNDQFSFFLLSDAAKVKFHAKNEPVSFKDDGVDIYSVAKNFERIRSLEGPSSFISHLDWADDSKHIQTNSGAGERILFQVEGKGNAIVDKLPKGVEWASWTCVFGREVDGLWAKYTDINDINAVDTNFHYNVIVSGDDFGLVKLFRYPCTKRGSKPRASVGHSEHVTNVRWTHDSGYVVSVGGADHGLFVWKFRPSRAMVCLAEMVISRKIEEDSDEDVLDTEDELEAIPEITGEIDEELSNSKAGLSKRRRRRRTLSPGKNQTRVELCDDSVFAKRRVTADEENKTNKPPPYRLVLEHVFGYRSYDCRNNCHWLSNKEIVYHTAAIGIVCTPETGEQRHYLNHTDDILCLTVHPDNELIASGQIGHNPSIHVWSSSSLKILSYLEGGHEKGVSAVTFSEDGERLASIGMDEHHSIVVWKWFKGQKIASVRNYAKNVFGVSFSPSTSNQLMTFGVKHIRVWTIVGSGMTWRKIKLGPKFRSDTALSCAVIPAESSDKWVIGMASGYILIVSHVGIERCVKAHKGAVFSIFTSDKETNSAWTGGKDGLICEWNQQFEKSLKNIPVSDHSLDIDSAVTLIASQSCIRTLKWNKDAEKPFLIGTQNSEILLMASGGEISILQQGHCKGELWGIAAHPSEQELVSVSDDRTLRRWSLGEMKAIGFLSLRKVARCVDFHPKGMLLAVGFLDGSVSLLAYPLLERIGGAHHRQESISDIRFSPDGCILAVASHDSFVDLYVIDTDGDIVSKESKGMKRLGVCRDASSFITHVTWHKDSRMLQINSGAGEQLFYEAPKGRRLLIPEKSEKDLAWDSPLTCPLDVTLAGVWQPSNDLTDINAVATAHKLPLVATASDEGGLLKLFTHPCLGKLKRYRQYGAHSSHVTNVIWTFDDTFVVTAGGADTSIIIWKVHDEMVSEKQEAVSAEALQALQKSDVDEEDVTLKDYEIAGLSEMSPLPPVIDSRRRTFDKTSSEERRNSEQFLIAVQKLRALPTMKGDSLIFFLFQNDIRKIELDNFKVTRISSVHEHHESPVTAMTISNTDPCMVASAEMIIPLVHIWHPQDGTTVTKLRVDGNTKIITCISFCSNGRLIAVLCDASVIHVFNWIKGKHISKAQMKVGSVIDMKFASETTVAVLTPKALFLCDLVGNALLPIRTLVPPGILPNPNVVLTSLTVNDKENVVVGCSDKFLVEWDGRVAVRRKGKELNKRRGSTHSMTSVSTSPPVRLVITTGKDYIYTAHRTEHEIVIQTFAMDDLHFHEEYRTPAPTETWKPSAISFGSSSLVMGALKETPLLLFDTLRKRFEVIQTNLILVDKGRTVNVTIPTKKQDSSVDASDADAKVNIDPGDNGKGELKDVTTNEKAESANDELQMENISTERKNSKAEKEVNQKSNRKNSWFRKWLPS